MRKDYHKNRKWHDPTKTTCRDNPMGGKSPALTRATNFCAAQEAKNKYLPTAEMMRQSIEFGMSVAAELKHLIS